jgi:drug/metabolite transporter (DMT)-like permease
VSSIPVKANSTNAALPAINLRFELCLLGVLACLWGSSYLFIKIALTTIPPVTLMAVRVSVAALFLIIVMQLQAERLPRDTQSWKELFIQSLLNSSVAWLVLAWGAQYVPSGLAGVLNSSSPLFVFLIGAVSAYRTKRPVGTKRPTAHGPLQTIGVLLGFLGVIGVVGVDALRGLGQQTLAQIALLFGAFLYACAALNGKRLAHLSSLATATGTMLWGMLCLVPMSLIIDQPWTLRPSLESALAAGALSLFGTGVALIIYFRLIKTLGAMGVASQSYLRAGLSVLLGFMILGEQLSAAVYAGLVAIIIGVALINLPGRRGR